MDNFIELKDSHGNVYKVNTDNISYVFLNATGKATIFFDKDHSIIVVADENIEKL